MSPFVEYESAPDGVRNALVSGLARLANDDASRSRNFDSALAEESAIPAEAKRSQLASALDPQLTEAAGPIPVYQLDPAKVAGEGEIEACASLRGWKYLITSAGNVTAEATVVELADGTVSLASVVRPGNAVAIAEAVGLLENEPITGELRLLECLSPGFAAAWLHPQAGNDILIPLRMLGTVLAKAELNLRDLEGVDKEVEIPERLKILRGWNEISPVLSELAIEVDWPEPSASSEE